MERIVIYFAVYLFCFYSFHRMRGHNLWRIKLPLTAGFLNYWRFLKSIVCIKQWNQHLKSIITWLFLIEIAKLECGLVEKHFSFLSISNLFTEVLHNFITPFCNWATFSELSRFNWQIFRQLLFNFGLTPLHCTYQYFQCHRTGSYKERVSSPKRRGSKHPQASHVSFFIIVLAYGHRYFRCTEARCYCFSDLFVSLSFHLFTFRIISISIISIFAFHSCVIPNWLWTVKLQISVHHSSYIKTSSSIVNFLSRPRFSWSFFPVS